ncbi:MAG: hypothetical protein CMI09_08975 [Oceanospirillaceae bacterium]|nr:hypothetical protein [Oceanospirillaceae bacterium]
MSKCEQCGAEMLWDDSLCDKCAGVEISPANNLSQPKMVDANIRKSPFSMISMVFFWLAFFSFVGGVSLCFEFWPADPGIGRQWKKTVYMPSVIWLVVGFVQACFFVATAMVLHYLRKISISLEYFDQK